MSTTAICSAHHATTTKWLSRLFGYDGILPALVFFCPALLALLVGPGVVMELTAIVLPITAFFWRAAYGLKQINGNGCSMSSRRIQKGTLFCGLLALLLVDAFMILSWTVPRNALSIDDYRTTFGIYLVYVALMAFSSYPGRTIVRGAKNSGRRIEEY